MKHRDTLLGRRAIPCALAAAAGISAVVLATGATAAWPCGDLCGSGGTAGSVNVEQVLRRADGTVPLASDRVAPIDRTRPERIEVAVFGLG